MSQQSADTTIRYIYFCLRWLIKVKFVLGKIHTSCADLNIHFFSLYLPTRYLFSILKSLVMKLLQQFSLMFLLWNLFIYLFFAFALYTHSVCTLQRQRNESCFLFEPEGTVYQGQSLKNICGLFLCNRKFQLLRQLGNAPGRK